MKKNEAKIGFKDGYTYQIFGISASSSRYQTVLGDIVQVCRNKRFFKPIFIVTANSEFFLAAQKDRELKDAMNKANLVVPDGISIVAAMEYQRRKKGNILSDLKEGLMIGREILQGNLSGKTVAGAKLTRDLLDLAKYRKIRVFLLGGRKESVKEILDKDSGYVVGYQEDPAFNTEMEIGDRSTITMINQFKPDLLLVAFGHFKAEKWIAKNLSKIKAKVIMGVGSSLDEIAGTGMWKQTTPEWIERSGLRWLWRLKKNPKHATRVWNAVFVFVWKVFRGE